MLGAELRDLDAGINHWHYFIAYAVYFVAEYEGVFLGFIGIEIIKHGAVFGLLDGNDDVAFITELLNCFNGGREVAPVDGLGGAEGRFFNFAVRRLGGNAAKVNLLNREAIRSTEYGTYVVHTAHIIKHNYNREFILRLKFGYRGTVEFVEL